MEKNFGVISNLRLVPNQLTAVRFFAVPVLWFCAFRGQLTCIGIGLIIGLVTDLLDGAVARKLNQTSDFGSKFDSLADQFLQLSALIWVLMLMPEIFSENLFISLLAITIYITSLLVGLVKFKRMANLHLYLSKVGGLFLYIFLIQAFISGEYSYFLFIVAGILFILSSTETLILQLILPSVDSNIGSIFFRYLEADHPIRYWLSRLP
jgi:phosphatidylglycerophosphate synthase